MIAPNGDTYFADKDTWMSSWLNSIEFGLNNVKNFNEQMIDLRDTSIYNANTWYPVFGYAIPSHGMHNIYAKAALYDTGIPSWCSHSNGFDASVEVLDTAFGWGGRNYNCIILDDDFRFVSDDKTPIRYVQLHNSSRPLFYLRGGAKYYLWADYSCSWEICAQASEISSQVFKPETIPPETCYGQSVYYTRISDMNRKLDISCFNYSNGTLTITT